jgi:predicted DNA-binding transcriptional regulator AlpA
MKKQPAMHERPELMSPHIKTRRGLIRGTDVIWPQGIELRYGISAPTRWRWERSGRLPPRDINIGGRTGWRPETLERAESMKA